MINVLSEQLERVWYDGLCFQWLTTLNFYSFGDAGVGLGLARAETMRMIIIQYVMRYCLIAYVILSGWRVQKPYGSCTLFLL